MMTYNNIILNRKKPLVMIVDDNPVQQKAIEIFVKKEGYAVITADDGESCMEMTKRYIPDVILLDVLMPEPDGFEVCKIFQKDEVLKRIPIVFLSGLTDKDSINTGITIGGSDYLTKPIATKLLLSRLKTIIQSNRLQIETEHQSVINLAILENDVNIMVELDEDFMIQRTSSNFNRTFSRHLKEITQSIFFSLIHSDDYDQSLDALSGLNESKKAIQLTFKDRYFGKYWTWTMTETMDLDQNKRLICLGHEIEHIGQPMFFGQNVSDIIIEQNQSMNKALNQSLHSKQKLEETVLACKKISEVSNLIVELTNNTLNITKKSFDVNNLMIDLSTTQQDLFKLEYQNHGQPIMINHDCHRIENMIYLFTWAVRQKTGQQRLPCEIQNTSTAIKITVSLEKGRLTIDQAASIITKSQATHINEQLFQSMLTPLHAELKYSVTEKYITDFELIINK